MKKDSINWAEGGPAGKRISKETLNHRELIERISGLDVYRNTAEAYTDLITPVPHPCDARGPVFPPDWYDEYIFPHYAQILAPARAAGRKVVLVADGNLIARCRTIVSSYSPQFLKRAMSYLYIKETKSIFEIEHIKLGSTRTERFIALLQLAENEDFCEKAHLLDLQNRISSGDRLHTGCGAGPERGCNR